MEHCPICGEEKELEVMCPLCGDVVCVECSTEGKEYEEICMNCIEADKEK